jgi:HEAT repeat protein
LAGDKEVMVRKAAVQALGAFQSQLANQALRRAAKDSDTAIRELAETLLQDRGENASQNPIARFFRKLTGGS